MHLTLINFNSCKMRVSSVWKLSINYAPGMEKPLADNFSHKLLREKGRRIKTNGLEGGIPGWKGKSVRSGAGGATSVFRGPHLL